MTTTPVEVSDELFGRHRGRFDSAVGLGSEGFCELPSANGRLAQEARR